MPRNGPPRFRFSAKRAFLTYSQCGDLTKERVLQYLREDRGCQWYLVGLEQHEDGGNHIHAYGEWADRLDVTDCAYFDVDGHHPNIQSVRNRADVLAYCKKGGDYIGNCEELSPTTVRYGDIIRDARGVDEFLELVVEHHPRDAALYLSSLQGFANWRYGRPLVEYVSPYTSFVVPEQLARWKREELDGMVMP